MNEPRIFVAVLTLLLGAGFLAPMVINRPGKLRLASLYVSLLLNFIASAFGIARAIQVLQTSPEQVQTAELWRSSWIVTHMPPLRMEVRIDHLSAFFILLIAGFSAVVAIYSFAAFRASQYQRQRHRIASGFSAFVWATLMVVIVNDVFSLIAVLEIMTLAFAFLTLFKHNLYLEPGEPDPGVEKKKDARLAPQIYLIVSQTSMAFLVAAFILLAVNAQSLSFDDLRRVAKFLPATRATVIFLLALIGLGIRAGLTPAHFWVSLVHPASPTVIYALSFGVAIKVAIYLMLRCFFQFLTPQVWWGYVVLLLAATTALVNVWYAIASHDLKKALAYHSIENIGIIMVGIGLALAYAAIPANAAQTDAARWISALALIASLYHLLNHAVFKGLLYLCTGAIDNLTHQVVDIEKLGGLIKLYPWTSATFLIGAVSISGFPPFNGFVSEWLTLQALLAGLNRQPADVSAGALVIILGLALLVASFALTAFCFVKIAGIAILGAPRINAEKRKTWEPHDVAAPMWLVMLLMASLCLMLGLLPTPVINVLSGVVGTILDQPVAVASPSFLGLDLGRPAASGAQAPALFMPPFLALAVLLGLGMALFIRLRNHRLPRQIIRPDSPWNCGTKYLSGTIQATGASLSFLIRDTLGAGWEPSQDRAPPDYLPARLELSAGAAASGPAYPMIVIEIFRLVYNRSVDWLLVWSGRIGATLQNGDLGRYLLYILAANLLALLAFILVRGKP